LNEEINFGEFLTRANLITMNGDKRKKEEEEKKKKKTWKATRSRAVTRQLKLALCTSRPPRRAQRVSIVVIKSAD
jgi:hypothetical protein